MINPVTSILLLGLAPQMSLKDIQKFGKFSFGLFETSDIVH